MLVKAHFWASDATVIYGHDMISML